MVGKKLKNRQQKQSAEREGLGAGKENEEDEESLYGNINDYKHLIQDEEYDDENGSHDPRFSEDEYNSERDSSLLAEFSDYGEISEDDEEDFMNAIREASNFKVKKKKKNDKGKSYGRQRKERVLDPEVAQLLSEANEAFVRNDLQVAERLFNEVIKKDARNFAAYETLGDIYQLQGRLNDCCNSWFLAAHLNASDWEFWKIVAILSADLDHVRQAIYCFSRVISLNPMEWESIYRRAILYKKTGQLARALDGFQKLYIYSPYDANILRELAILYVDYDRIDDSIELYMKVFNANVERREAIMAAVENALDSSEEESAAEEEVEEKEPLEQDEDMQMFPEINWKKINAKYKCIPFDWSFLNILAELFLKHAVGEVDGIKAIKKCARWVQRRELQRFWDDVPDDSEFDNRRFKNSTFDSLPAIEKEKSYTIPIDIRVRLGLLRLDTDNLVEALNHFQCLYDETFTDVADLYFEAATALTRAEKYKEAIDFFTPLLSLDEWRTTDVFKPLARCYKETENYETAKEFYELAIKSEPGDLDIRVSLAEVHYHLNDPETFKNMLVDVVEMRKHQVEETLHSLSAEKGSNDISNNISSKPLLEDSKFRTFRKKKRTPYDAERERIERERRITAKVVDKYQKIKKFKFDQALGEVKQASVWINTVSELVDIFSSVKNFFMKSRSRKFVGILRRTKKFNTELDFQIERLSKLAEGDSVFEGPLMEERVTLTSATELRGLSYEQWFELFMELSLVITKYQSVEDGLSVVETAQEVNVFFQDPERVKMMKFVKLAIVLHMDDEEELAENLRGLLNQFQFNRKVLQVFMYSLCRGPSSLNILSSTIQQKFFLRQLKAFDSCRYNTEVNGQASITNKEVDNPDKKSSPYLYYIYAVLLYSSRGFLSALQYLTRLENDIPDDPMVNLLMGLSHIHRAMQRLTAQRHFQILHGLRYLYRYYTIRKDQYTDLEKQEADYNLGRAFHLIGLVSIAVEYYNRVLENYHDEKLKKHAAYNSIIIYQQSGNAELADNLMEKYLSI
ncbi:transcription factor TFIIIC subunit TFC4 SKDI_07G3010 [Saccharomyces kudriavzevii IFO 1802]|uniref:TFC4-like protein n=1 Tax=Saccharomyces kudriavzevii (strain ATCC MYA-4449 / AS 2.2408 / CBS 8840 / NBRC 1802 / NCYC 2889) TaxID=226230 RepID=A0AA35NSI0_SACK1|nr:uncharacterized protein SKDI_07G3010 [Saccharomyces kudriavzevii IFO 1802]CAI4062223.1 hypothetical protein SKDI_07G3010 [Saccharomyces kudriavzevii IFO 1802]